MNIEKAIAEELTLSYMQAGRSVTGENVVIVAQSLARSVDFESVEEVRESFKRARDVADVPTQRVLKDTLKSYRMEKAPNTPAIGYGTSRDERPVTEEERNYIMAWWHLHGTRFPFLTDEEARRTVEAFERKDPEFASYQRKFTHVAQENVDRYGVVTCKARFA